MNLKGVHFLLTYKCDLECDHCFVWGKPEAKGTFTLKQIRSILAEAKKLRTLNYISIEGGEPFLYYPIMVKAVKEAVNMGFHVEILSNCYRANCQEDAVEWLLPIAEVGDVELSLSSDIYHGEAWETEKVKNAIRAANTLNIKVGVVAIEYPDVAPPCPSEIEGAKVGLCDLMFRGRAASKLAGKAQKKSWLEHTKCPHENLVNPERVHIDPLGYVHVCQGISIGNTWEKPFSEIIEAYNPHGNPILKPLINGGPRALVEEFDLPHEEAYADACHMCYAARLLLRSKYPRILAPNQMYGENE